MKNIKAVIGANFGDEGKGVMTDYLSSSLKNGIVVRFNGGAQAGHTVTTADGKRHVFGHIGSGTFAGLPTYLSSFFIVNPMLFIKELKSMDRWNVAPKVHVDINCVVTTPFDMIINQIAEMVRGSSKHGSCGLGINETINRSLLEEKYKITVKDLMNEDLIREKLYFIKNEYTPERLKQLGIETIPEKYRGLFNNAYIIEAYISDIKYMLNFIEITNITILKQFNSIIFEGAQGLLLDQSHEYFPHVTRSNTGMRNVRDLINEAGYSNEEVEVIYTTRAYLTRHGAGPFPTELPKKPYQNIVDFTNVPNPYQDSLRFGLLDLDYLAKTIQNDLLNTEGLKHNVKLAISCLDQINEEVDYYVNSTKVKSSTDEFIHKAMQSVEVKKGYINYGVTRNTISSYSF